jgi:hypothetical protein
MSEVKCIIKLNKLENKQFRIPKEVILEAMKGNQHVSLMAFIIRFDFRIILEWKYYVQLFLRFHNRECNYLYALEGCGESLGNSGSTCGGIAGNCGKANSKDVGMSWSWSDVGDIDRNPNGCGLGTIVLAGSLLILFETISTKDEPKVLIRSIDSSSSLVKELLSVMPPNSSSPLNRFAEI